MSFETSCHCGAMKASVAQDLPTEGMTCNCSICRRRGHILHFAPADVVTVEAAEGAVSDYTFNKHAIHHQFCAECGCSPFGKGSDGQGNEMIAVNLRCVEECDLDALKVNAFDGAAL